MILKPSDVRKLHRRLDGRRIPITVITPAEAIELFRRAAPDRPVTVLTRTEAHEVRKSGVPAPYKDCLVVKKRKVILNQPYQDAVNERRVVEHNQPNFRAAARPYGESIGLPFVVHAVGGRHWELYIQMHVEQELGREYYEAETMRPLDTDQVNQYLRPPRDGGRQKLDKEVQFRNYQASNVLALFLPGPRGGEKGYIIDAAGTRGAGKARVAAARTKGVR